MSARDAAEHRMRREAGLVHLIGVGDMPGTPACHLSVGDRLMWNYGSVYKVLSVQEVSPRFVEIRERPEDKPDGDVYTRRLRKNRLVVRLQAGERLAKASAYGPQPSIAWAIGPDPAPNWWAKGIPGAAARCGLPNPHAHKPGQAATS